MPDSIPDFTKTIFLHSQYLKYVLATAMLVGILLIARSWLIWRLHKKFGGYKHSKELARRVAVSIDGPFKLTAQPLLVAAIALLLGLTLLEPRIKANRLEKEYEPAQIVIALDSTISMLAEDVKPSRLLAAKTVIGDLISRLEQEGSKDKVGFIRFTDIAIPVIIIPTKDYDLLKYELRLTTSSYIKMFENHGTNIWDAVTQGLHYFAYAEDQEKILIIISDGEQVADSEYIDQTRNEAIAWRFNDPYHRSVKIFLIGIGRVAEPSVIPKEKDENGNVVEFYTEAKNGPGKGRLIQTTPNSAYLQEIADLISGRFFLAESKNELDKEVNKILKEERRVLGANVKPKLNNISPWFIGAILILLFFVPLVGIR